MNACLRRVQRFVHGTTPVAALHTNPSRHKHSLRTRHKHRASICTSSHRTIYGILPPHTVIIFCVLSLLALYFTPNAPVDDLNAVQDSPIQRMLLAGVLVVVLLIALLQTYDYFFNNRGRGPVGLVFPRRWIALEIVGGVARGDAGGAANAGGDAGGNAGDDAGGNAGGALLQPQQHVQNYRAAHAHVGSGGEGVANQADAAGGNSGEWVDGYRPNWFDT